MKWLALIAIGGVGVYLWLERKGPIDDALTRFYRLDQARKEGFFACLQECQAEAAERASLSGAIGKVWGTTLNLFGGPAVAGGGMIAYNYISGTAHDRDYCGRCYQKFL